MFISFQFKSWTCWIEMELTSTLVMLAAMSWWYHLSCPAYICTCTAPWVWPLTTLTHSLIAHLVPDPNPWPPSTVRTAIWYGCLVGWFPPPPEFYRIHLQHRTHGNTETQLHSGESKAATRDPIQPMEIVYLIFLVHFCGCLVLCYYWFYWWVCQCDSAVHSVLSHGASTKHKLPLSQCCHGMITLPSCSI